MSSIRLEVLEFQEQITVSGTKQILKDVTHLVGVYLLFPLLSVRKLEPQVELALSCFPSSVC